MSSLLLLSPIYPSPPTPALLHSHPMDASDCSDDDGDHLHTPLHLLDTNTAIVSSHSNESSDFFDFAAQSNLKYIHPFPRSVSPFDPSGRHSPFSFSAHPSSPHSQSDLSHNALQLDQLTYKSSDLSPQSSHFSLAPSSQSAYDSREELPSMTFPAETRPPSPPQPPAHPSRLYRVTTKASAYSRRFPRGHHLNADFVCWYQLGDELGAGGYGFVLTALHRLERREVAVKFIIKAKVPEHAWMEDKNARRVPTEALLLGLLNHPNVVKCMDLFEDDLYFYLVQELHGTPWVPHTKGQISAPEMAASYLPTPALTPSLSADSDLHVPVTPPQLSAGSGNSGEPASAKQLSASPKGIILGSDETSPSYLRPSQPAFSRRASHDLFECIEQSKDKRLSEGQARFVFAQIVQAVHYLDSQGVTHCDIKDENILVDNYLNVKLIDFGSAVVVDPSEPRPRYTLFFGTTAYAASEVLQKRPYRAPPAEIWTLGVLLSYLLTGASPFPTERDAISGRVLLALQASTYVSESAEQLMLRCLDPDPERRADIHEVHAHPWLEGALNLPLEERIL